MALFNEVAARVYIINIYINTYIHLLQYTAVQVLITTLMNATDGRCIYYTVLFFRFWFFHPVYSTMIFKRVKELKNRNDNR